MKATNKISDFGQKIGGARKDMARVYIDRLAAVTSDALIAKPLSKVYPLPDLRSLWSKGEITDTQAVDAWYIWTQIERKPTARGVMFWAEKTHGLLKLFTDVLTDNNTDVSAYAAEQRKQEEYNMFKEEVATAGWPEKEYKRGAYYVTTRLFNSSSYRPYTVASGRYYKKDFATMPEAVEYIRQLVLGEGSNKNKFEIRWWSVNKELFICPRGKSGIVLRRNIFDIAEARRIVSEEAEALEEEYNRLRTFPDERRDWNRPRLGENFRDGMDVSPETFSALVPFRGVEFGNWVNQLERAACLNECADALWDLAKITGLRLDALAQKGTLAMAFGARGVTKARAHYEPLRRVINITKRTGSGCLAHEWFHSLDNFLMINQGQPLLYAVDNCMKVNDSKLQQAAYQLKTALQTSDFAKRSEKMGKKYWGTMVELSARAFEAFVYYKMEAAGMVNDYLVNFKTLEEYTRSDCYPYPTPEEAARFAPLFEAFIDAAFTVDEKTTNVPSVCATPEVATVEDVAPEVATVAEVAESIAAAEPPATPADTPVSTYEDSQKLGIGFPEEFSANRKYFAVVETMCRDLKLSYSFILETEKKIRLSASLPDGIAVFDYEVTSRHCDTFFYYESGAKRRRWKNWSVAISAIKEMPESEARTPEEVGESVAYGDCEKSPVLPVAASESTATACDIELSEEDKDKMCLIDEEYMKEMQRKSWGNADFKKAVEQTVEILTFAGFKEMEKVFPLHRTYCKLNLDTSVALTFYLGEDFFSLEYFWDKGEIWYRGFFSDNGDFRYDDFDEWVSVLYGEFQKLGFSINLKFVSMQMIANGNIKSTDEVVGVVRQIISKCLLTEFAKYRSFDKDANASLNDLFDTIRNFPLFNAEITLYGDCLELGKMQFFGMTPEESLQKLFEYGNANNPELMDECNFKLRGVKGFLPYNSYLFHQCFAEGRISVQKLIDMLQEMEV